MRKVSVHFKAFPTREKPSQVSSVTRWFGYFLIFWHFQQREFAQQLLKLAKVSLWQILIDPFQNGQSLLMLW